MPTGTSIQKIGTTLRVAYSRSCSSTCLFDMLEARKRGQGHAFLHFEASKHAQAHAFEPPSVLRACFEASKHAQAHAFEPPSVLRACFEATEFDNTRRNTTSKPLDEALRRHWRRNRFENTILSTRSLRKLSTKLFEATGRSTSKALDEAAGRRNWTKKLDEETGRRNWTNQLSSKPPSSGQLTVTESHEFNLVYTYICLPYTTYTAYERSLDRVLFVIEVAIDRKSTRLNSSH